MNAPRLSATVLTLSAAGLIYGVVAYEGYTDKAIQPVPGDVPTYGFGSTVQTDGKPVRMGDTIAPPAALTLMARDVAMKEGALKVCFGNVLLTQGEYDAYVSLAYNVGAAAVCRSSIVGKLKAGQYAAACKTILDFRNVQGRNCCLPENARFCGGICTRRQKEYRTCVSGISSQVSGIRGQESVPTSSFCAKRSDVAESTASMTRKG
jgi:lysozyme